jgi:hypothetical protein
MAKKPNKPATQAPAAPVAEVAIAQVAAPVAAAPAAAPAKAPVAPLPATLAALPHMAKLPRSLVAKGANIAGAPAGIPPVLANVKLVPGKAFRCSSPHNAAWAALCIAHASQPGGATVAELLTAGATSGLGMHSVLAYYKRKWLVPAAA